MTERECDCGCNAGTSSCDGSCIDEIDPNTEGWLSCAELQLPPEFRMVNGMWSESGHSEKDFVDTSSFPPKVNEGLYLQVVALFGQEGVLFGDGNTPATKGITREAWKKRSLEESGAELDPLVQLAWQRKNQGVKVNGAKIGKERFKPKF